VFVGLKTTRRHLAHRWPEIVSKRGCYVARMQICNISPRYSGDKDRLGWTCGVLFNKGWGRIVSDLFENSE
jgi:hypothetical protein